VTYGEPGQGALSPIRWGNFNYAPIAFGVLLLIAAVWQALGARKRFQGPPFQGPPRAR
jgi:hypothetical protein